MKRSAIVSREIDPAALIAELRSSKYGAISSFIGTVRDLNDGRKVSSIEYQTGEGGAPDLIMASVTLSDGTEKTVAINPADGKVMNVTIAANTMTDGENGTDNGSDGENANN
jgi:hypothetical protein